MRQTRKHLKRADIASFADLTPCLADMEACAHALHWARRILAYGHTVKPMAAQFVMSYVRSNNNAAAICEVV